MTSSIDAVKALEAAFLRWSRDRILELKSVTFYLFRQCVTAFPTADC
jgi:hypothetical protein